MAKASRAGRVPAGRKLTVEEFTLRAIEKLAPEPGKGVHVVFSGFNEAFREYFPGRCPRTELDKLFQKGVINKRPSVKGAVISLPKKKKAKRNYRDELAKKALSKMGLT